MRFTAFRQNDRNGLAVGNGEILFGLMEGDSGYPGNLAELLVNSADLSTIGGLLAKGNPIDMQGIQILPPVMQPGKIICVGLNYADHSLEAGFEPPGYPTIFSRFASSLIGSGAAIVCPDVSSDLDYEAELVAVIGKAGRNISRSAALSHVIGYSIFNDGSIRDYQFKSPQWTMGKNFDATGAFGPLFVTTDELPPGGKGLRIQARLNGNVVQDDNTDNMIFDIETLVVLLSEVMTLLPGDLIVSGTPSGVGMARTPKLYMKPGDVCEIEIENIGVLRNPIGASSPAGRQVGEELATSS
jgi:2-keto-4-pentenoate hydratase/2-oxohepta-3-ene-1,7-dioic acid hydratase in catechol pathway